MDHMLFLYNFGGIIRLFSHKVHQILFPQQCMMVPPFFIPLAALGIFYPLGCTHSDSCQLISHSGFDLPFLGD